MAYDYVTELQSISSAVRPPLSLGKAGWWVRMLCGCLTAHGYKVATTSNYDMALKTVVQGYQRQHGLVADGIVGAKTWAMLAKEPTPAVVITVDPVAVKIRNTIVMVARYIESLDIREGRKPNTGASVEWFLHYAGGKPGQPWCVAFAFGVVQLAYAICDEYAPDGMPSLSCSTLVKWAEAAGRVVDDPQPGDLLVLRGGDTGYCHVAVIVEVNGGKLITIEGNTNQAGSPDGDGVYQRERQTASGAIVRAI